MSRQNYSTGSPWEPVVGYSRAVRAGNQVFVTGTTALGADGKLTGRGDAYAQTVQILQNIESVLHRAGAELRHVVRTRIFVTDIELWQEIGRAHREFLGEIRPCTTMVEVRRLIDSEMLAHNAARAAPSNSRKTLSPRRLAGSQFTVTG